MGQLDTTYVPPKRETATQKDSNPPQPQPKPAPEPAITDYASI